MSKPTVFPEKTDRKAERAAEIAERDELILAAMIVFPGDTAGRLAERVGLSARGLHDRTSAPAFQQRLAELRATSLADAAALAMSQAVNAVQVIQGVMTNSDTADRDRLTASRLMIEAAIKLRDAAFIGPQLAAVRAELAVLTTHPHGTLPPSDGADSVPPPPPMLDAPAVDVCPDVAERFKEILDRSRGQG